MTQFVRHLRPDPEIPGEFLIDLGDDLVSALGWQAGDYVQWTQNPDNSWTVQKINPDQN